MNPFDFVNSINLNKKNLMVNTENDKLAEESYNTFIVNRTLSYFSDTLMISNLMNINPHIDNKLQYSFLLNIVKPKKRFTKWVKKQQSDDVELVMEYYKFSRLKALQALKLLSPVHIEEIRKIVERGTNKDVNN